MSSVGSILRQVASGLLPPKLGVLHQHEPMPMTSNLGIPAPALPSPAPRVSIVTPSFRQGAFIGRTIESVLSQGYPDLQFLVQDGGSTDETVDVLKSYGDRLGPWVSEPDKGQSDALQKVFARTDGQIMAYLNSDDLLMPGCLATVTAAFTADPDLDVVYGHRLIIDEHDREVGRWIMPKHDDEALSWADFVPQETLFWRRSAWDRAGAKIDASFRFAMDWDLLLRLRDSGARIRRIPRILGAFRVHAASKTSSIINDVGRKEMTLLRERSLKRVPSDVEIGRYMRPYVMQATILHHLHRLRHGP